jgi:hypothetical protein
MDAFVEETYALLIRIYNQLWGNAASTNENISVLI